MTRKTQNYASTARYRHSVRAPVSGPISTLADMEARWD